MRKKIIRMTMLLLFTIFTLTACQKESVNIYQIGFETNGGNSIDNVMLEAGEKLTMPSEPQKEGMSFAGWYLDEELTKPFTAPDVMPEESFWLFAAWNVTLTFDCQGGDAVESIVAKEGSIIGNLPKATYDDNLFLGWYVDKECTKKMGLVMPDCNTTVYAKWQSLESMKPLDLTDTLQINDVKGYVKEEVDGGYKITATEEKGEWAYFWFTIDSNVKAYSTFEIIVEGEAGTNYMTKLEAGGVKATEVARTLSGKEETIYWTVDAENLTETGGEKFIIFLNQGNKGASETPEYIIIKSIKLYRSADLEE